MKKRKQGDACVLSGIATLHHYTCVYYWVGVESFNFQYGVYCENVIKLCLNPEEKIKSI